MLTPSLEDLAAITADAVLAADKAGQVTRSIPLPDFTQALTLACRESPDALADTFREASQMSNSRLAFAMMPRPLGTVLGKMFCLHEAMNECRDFHPTWLMHDGEYKTCEYLEFIQQHSAKAIHHRYLVRDRREGVVFGFQTGHEAAFWWLKQIKDYEEYCHERLFYSGAEWWRETPEKLCRVLEHAAENGLLVTKLNAERLKELIRDEAFSMQGTIEGRVFQRRPQSDSSEWLTELENIDMNEPLNVFLDHDGWPVVKVRHLAPAKRTAEEYTWHDKRVQVKHLTQMMQDRGMSASKNTVTKRILEWQAEGKIDRDGNGPMKLRMDLFHELNPNQSGKPQ